MPTKFRTAFDKIVHDLLVFKYKNRAKILDADTWTESQEVPGVPPFGSDIANL
jgi:hypothetical protein